MRLLGYTVILQFVRMKRPYLILAIRGCFGTKLLSILERLENNTNSSGPKMVNPSVSYSLTEFQPYLHLIYFGV